MKVCSIEGCDREHYAKGWCRLHWGRHARNGDPLVTRVGGHGCSVCGHQDEASANDAILAGAPYVDVASRAGVSRAVVGRHARECLRYVRPIGNGSPCSVCDHASVGEIDELLGDDVPPHRVAVIFGLEQGVVYNHARPAHQRRRMALAAARLAAVRRYVDS